MQIKTKYFVLTQFISYLISQEDDKKPKKAFWPFRGLFKRNKKKSDGIPEEEKKEQDVD